MKEKKYQKYISTLTEPSEGSLKFHSSGGEIFGPRYRFFWDNALPEGDIKILVRHVLKDRVSSEYPDIVERHVHDVSKAYIALSEEPGGLELEVTLGDEEYTVRSPGAVFVPPGIQHHIRISKGHGFYILVVPAKGSYDDHTFPVS